MGNVMISVHLVVTLTRLNTLDTVVSHSNDTFQCILDCSIGPQESPSIDMKEYLKA